METVFRVAIIYLFLMFALRIMGKREFGQLSPLELVTLLLIPELVSQALLREDFSITNAIIAMTTLFTMVFLTSLVMQRSKKAERAIAGEPTVLVYHGKLVPEHLHKERVTESELFSEMHKSGLDRLEQVRWAILESDGKIAIIPEDSGDQARGPQIINEEKALV
jgi:uncharacterized membrane protein YcaP (DUF421 family)